MERSRRARGVEAGLAERGIVLQTLLNDLLRFEFRYLFISVPQLGEYLNRVQSIPAAETEWPKLTSVVCCDR